MPGLSIVCGTDVIEKSLSSLKHHQNIAVTTDILSKKFSVVRSGFSGYPFLQYSNEDFAVFLEGFIYNLPLEETKEGLSRIAMSYLKKLDFKGEIARFISNCSGEFVALICFAKTGDLLLFNDQWGRLPFFWFKEGNKLILSREIKFILHYISKIFYDRTALLEYLILRYPFGDRTIFKDILKLSPGHLIVHGKNFFSLEDVVGLNFDSLCFESRPRKYYIGKAKNILFSSTKNRLAKLEAFNSVAVDISGGHDTRAILAVVSQLSRNFAPMTIDLVTGDESGIAKRVAKACGFDVLLIKPNRDFSFSRIQDVLYKTDGFIDGWVATSSYQDTEEIRRQLKEPVAEFMGFGGEFLRHPLKTLGHFRNMLDVVNDVSPSLTAVRSLCRCLGLREREVYAFWNNFFDSIYRENKIEDKVMHYYFDYYRLYVGEGEDRRRIYLWPVNPMLSSEWLRFSTKEMPRDLIGYQLFEEILQAIDPQIAVSKIPVLSRNSLNQKFLFAVMNLRVIQLITGRKIVRRLYKMFRQQQWKKTARRDSKRKIMIEEIEQLYQNTKTVREYFDRQGLVQFYTSEFGHNNLFLRLLHSIFIYMNKIESMFSEHA